MQVAPELTDSQKSLLLNNIQSATGCLARVADKVTFSASPSETILELTTCSMYINALISSVATNYNPEDEN